MFFTLSKTLGFFAAPSNLLISIGVLGLILLCTRFTRLASWLIVTSLVLLAVAGFSPLGNAFILPLEERFPPWNPSHGAPDGIVVLGGAILSERITATAELARRYPNARIIFSGGSSSLIYDEEPETRFAVRQLEALGVAHDRIAAEDRSRNTLENAAYSLRLAHPKPGERWLLVTSAYHMPRAMAAFRAVGFVVEAYPVDWRTRGPEDLTRPFGSLAEGLRRTDTAVREWVGLLVYRVTGKSATFFPAP
jgi:uncharacterized SAM-binding protein YcdF (DUF218 family)